MSCSRSTRQFFPPDDDESGVGIATEFSPPSAGSDLRKGDLRGECLGLSQGVSWTTTTRF